MKNKKPFSAPNRVKDATMGTPLVTVVIPVKNGERFLVETIDTVLAQAYEPIEIIVVDGRSDDNTANIAKSYPQISCILQTGFGLWDGYNVGLEAAKGKYIAFLSHDDLWPTHKISTQVDYLTKHPEYQYAISRVKFFLEEGCELPANFRPEHLEGDHVFRIVDNLMVRRTVFDEVGKFNPDLHIGGYIDWFSRA